MPAMLRLHGRDACIGLQLRQRTVARPQERVVRGADDQRRAADRGQAARHAAALVVVRCAAEAVQRRHQRVVELADTARLAGTCEVHRVRVVDHVRRAAQPLQHPVKQVSGVMGKEAAEGGRFC